MVFTSNSMKGKSRIIYFHHTFWWVSLAMLRLAMFHLFTYTRHKIIENSRRAFKCYPCIYMYYGLNCMKSWMTYDTAWYVKCWILSWLLMQFKLIIEKALEMKNFVLTNSPTLMLKKYLNFLYTRRTIRKLIRVYMTKKNSKNIVLGSSLWQILSSVICFDFK